MKIYIATYRYYGEGDYEDRSYHVSRRSALYWLIDKRRQDINHQLKRWEEGHYLPSWTKDKIIRNVKDFRWSVIETYVWDYINGTHI